MSRSSATDDRGAVEPLVALVAVLVVGVLLSAYAAGLESVLGGDQRRHLADAVLVETVDHLTHDGVVRPDRLNATAVAPDGYRVNVTVRAGDRTWADGPSPPADARHTSRRVSVRFAPGDVRPGRVRVEVWT